MLTILKKAASETPKAGVHRAEVKMLDDRRFVVIIPQETVDMPCTLFLGNKPLGGWSSARPDEKDQIEEPKEDEAIEHE